MRGRPVSVTAVVATCALVAFVGSQAAVAQRTLGRVRATGDWAMYGFDPAQTGYNQYETILSPDNVGKLQTRWTAIDGQTFDSPVVVGRVVYVAVDVGMYAVDADTGAVLWKNDLGHRYGFGGAAVADGVVFATSNGPGSLELDALDAATGEQLWSFEMDHRANIGARPLIVSGGVIYAVEYTVNTPIQSGLFAIRAADGTLLWEVRRQGATFSVPAVSDSVPAASGGLVYVADGKKLRALDAATGALVWSVPGQGGGHVAAGNEKVYFGSGAGDTGKIQALDPSNGTVLWATDLTAYVSSLSVAQDGLYVVTGGYLIQRFDAATGAQLWSQDVGFNVHEKPAVANGVVYTGGYVAPLVALDAATGDRLWENQVDPDADYLSPAVSNGVLYVTWLDQGGFEDRQAPGHLLAFGL